MSVAWALLVVLMVSVIAASLWREELPDGKPAPQFELIDQNEQPVTLKTLAGKPWIADFIFTNCAGPCPLMSAKMAELQKVLPPAVQLVSFSVDPDRDTPAVLRQYAQGLGADETRWRFLTGDKDAIYAASRGMLLALQPGDDKNQILHSTKFILIDREGKIRKYYDSNDEQEMAALKQDAADLAEDVDEGR
jgi:protein SCO1/2